jgi:hypothetical protein
VTTTRFDPLALAPGNGHSGASPWPPRTPKLPQTRRQRRPLMALLAVVLIFGTAGVFSSLYMSSSKRSSVLTISRDVTAGTVIARADLGVAEVAGSGLTAIAVAQAPAVIGKIAAVDLRAGTLLTSPMLTSETLPGVGQAIVGIALKPGFLPGELSAGAVVQVVRVPLPAANTEETPGEIVIVAAARVLKVSSEPSVGAILVDLVVPSEKANDVARAAAISTVGLVQVRKS